MAIIPHLGSQAESGHYLAITRCRDNTDYWAVYDGDKAKKIQSTKQILAKYCNDAYLLFYRVKMQDTGDTAMC